MSHIWTSPTEHMNESCHTYEESCYPYGRVGCGVLRCVAVCCGALRCVAVCCGVLHVLCELQ